MLFKITKVSCSFCVCEVLCNDIFSARFFFLFTNALPASVSFSNRRSFYADNVVIWSSCFVSTAAEAIQRTLVELER